VTLAVGFAVFEIGAFEPLEPEVDLLVGFVVALDPGRELRLEPGEADSDSDVRTEGCNDSASQCRSQDLQQYLNHMPLPLIRMKLL
jgi:hypothetical protein